MIYNSGKKDISKNHNTMQNKIPTSKYNFHLSNVLRQYLYRTHDFWSEEGNREWKATSRLRWPLVKMSLTPLTGMGFEVHTLKVHTLRGSTQVSPYTKVITLGAASSPRQLSVIICPSLCIYKESLSRKC